jgi:hypothetical protein
LTLTDVAKVALEILPGFLDCRRLIAALAVPQHAQDCIVKALMAANIEFVVEDVTAKYSKRLN